MLSENLPWALVFIGAFIAIAFAVIGIDSVINISGAFTTGQIGGVVAIILMVVFVWMSANKKEK